MVHIPVYTADEKVGLLVTPHEGRVRVVPMPTVLVPLGQVSGIYSLTFSFLMLSIILCCPIPPILWQCLVAVVRGANAL